MLICYIIYSKDITEDLLSLELKEFLDQMNLFLKEGFRILKKNKYGAVLIGDMRKNKSIVEDFYAIFLSRSL